jgi:hypothetical protein
MMAVFKTNTPDIKFISDDAEYKEHDTHLAARLAERNTLHDERQPILERLRARQVTALELQLGIPTEEQDRGHIARILRGEHEASPQQWTPMYYYGR